MEVKELILQMPWGNVALKCWNSSSLPPMLVVHGSRLNSGSFDPLIPNLLPHYFYVCVDLPGHGLSDPLTPGLPLQFMHFVHVLQRITASFKWSSYSLMGHSIGALMQLFLAATNRAKVQRLILLDFYIAPPAYRENYLDRAYADFRYQNDVESYQAQHGKTRTYDDILKRLMNPYWGLRSETAAKSVLARDLKQNADGFYSTTDPRKLLFVKPYITEEHLLYFCKHIQCPVLVILADEGPVKLMYEKSIYYQQVLNNLSQSHVLSQIRNVEGGHSVFCDNPKLVAPIVNDFFLDTKHIQSSSSKL